MKDLSVQELIEEAKKLGCGDSSCRFIKPTGMHTNGGCRCFDSRRTHLDRHPTWILYQLGELVKRLGEELEKATKSP